jgi:hypothetical protein
MKTLLDAYLTPELGRPPSIFIDEQIQPGVDWPMRLGGALGRARVLLAIFSRDYFGSEWCIHELDLMHSRSMRFPESRLIIPVIGHDGDLIPNEIARLQPFDLSAFRNTDIQRKTPRFEQFSESVKTLAPNVAEAIESAPPFDDSWSNECQSRFNEVYEASQRGMQVPVSSLTRKQMPFPVIPRVQS